MCAPKGLEELARQAGNLSEVEVATALDHEFVLDACVVELRKEHAVAARRARQPVHPLRAQRPPPLAHHPLQLRERVPVCAHHRGAALLDPKSLKM